ncbi:MAG: SGNH/GDSL hydrolase family protein [Planctomycetaceae bacterium]|nr:SGNH/GDSL hydrolase family protein [Planctomycetaceae bacterium]
MTCKVIHIFSLTTCLLMVLFNLPQATASETSLRDLFTDSDGPVNVVCLGDSVTGVYYHTGGRRAYSAMVEIGLRRVFPKKQINVINAGISGNTTVDGLNRLERDVLSKSPDLVTIMFSLNDMTRVPLTDFEANLKTMIEQIKATGSLVLLCTPNSVFDSTGRPVNKLEQYVTRIRTIAEREKIPLADCYAAYEKQRQEDEWNWVMWMSDDIHPNMGGHKRIAETIVERISGQPISLEDVPPLLPHLPHTIAKLRAGKPVQFVAMPPYDVLVEKLVRHNFPQAKLNIEPWPVANLSLKEIELSADRIRAVKPDWVIINLPREILPSQNADELRHLSWILNKSLSFGQSEWDCLVMSPDLTRSASTNEEKQRGEILHQFVRNQDLPLLTRSTFDSGEQIDSFKLFQKWWEQEQKQSP